jgi:non-ribosomal peptide synthase protein (TIGR01720 family)
MYVPLVSGGRVIVFRGEDKQAVLEEVVKDERVEVMKATPSHLEIIKEWDNGESRIRRLIVGGEALRRRLCEEVEKSFGREMEIYNEYGPTEATVGCMLKRYERGEEREYVTIGRPGANTQIYILDERGRICGEGEIGEIHIGGECLAEGYIGEEEKTAEKFVANAYREGERVYRSGDEGRMVDGEEVEYVGRKDEQVKYHGYRIELGEIRRAMNEKEGIRDSVVVMRRGVRGEGVLVGYYVSRREVSEEEMKEHMRERVIEEVMPRIYVRIGKMPLTVNGKVNVEGLPGLEEVRKGRKKEERREARGEVEREMVKIWEEVLGVEGIGIDDNFFELGGDSILSIQIIAKSNRVGIRLTPKQLFERQTIAQLVSVAGSKQLIQADQAIVTGFAPLTPIQHWFFEQNLSDPHHFNQSVMLECKDHIDSAALNKAILYLMQHHDALRLRFTRKERGWIQTNAGVEEKSPITELDLSHLDEPHQRLEIEKNAAQMQTSLDLEHGPILRVGLFRKGEGNTDRLLILIHHLAVDGVSWRVLLEDLQIAYQQAAEGKEIKLAPKTTSYKQWGESIENYAKREEAAKEAAYWQNIGEGIVSVIPLEKQAGENTERSGNTVREELSEAETIALLQEVPKAYNTHINEILLAALLEAISEWSNKRRIVVQMEGHGREESIIEGIDLSRTVGWFTSIYPMELEKSDWKETGEMIKSVKEQVRGVVGKGIGYGILKYVRGDKELTRRLKENEVKDISFNYLGQFDQVIGEETKYSGASESSGPTHSPEAIRPHLIDVVASISGGRLQITWIYSENLHHRETIERVARSYTESLQSIIAHCQLREARGYTPSDFPEAELTQKEIDELVAELEMLWSRDESGEIYENKIESIYPLSPVQQGMLFHTLVASDPGAYFQQLSCKFVGTLNVEAFKQAWQRLVDRHTILRTAISEHNGKHLQIVPHQVTLNWDEQDWRDLSAAEQEQYLKAYFEADRSKGFQVNRSPLMRLGVIRIAEDAYQFYWSFHHLLLDGWSTPLLMNELFAFYEAICQGEELRLEATRPYKDYISWLKQQDMTEAQEFWQETLKGFSASNPLKIDGESRNNTNLKEARGEKRGSLSAETSATLQALAHEHHLTLNTIMSGMWALILGHHSERDDVIFGAVVSGRPTSLSGIESMIGLFINTLPTRVQIHSQSSLFKWLKEIQAHQTEIRQYEHSPLVDVQRWSEVPRNRPLFESALVFENYPVIASSKMAKQLLTVRELRAVDPSHYPINITVGPGQRLALQVTFDSSRFDDAAITGVLEDFVMLLDSISKNPDIEVKELQKMLKESGKRRRVEKQKQFQDARRRSFEKVRVKPIAGSKAN